MSFSYNPEVAYSGWSSEISYFLISHGTLVGNRSSIHSYISLLFYICILYLYYLSMFLYLSWSLTILQVFLYYLSWIYFMYIVFISCTKAYRIYIGHFPCIYASSTLIAFSLQCILGSKVWHYDFDEEINNNDIEKSGTPIPPKNTPVITEFTDAFSKV